MERRSEANGAVTPASLTIEIPIEVAGDWIHFGFSVGISPIYHTKATGTSSLYVKVYEELFGWHNRKRYRDWSDYTFTGDESNLTNDQDHSEIVKFQLSVFNDAEKRDKNVDNIFGIRLIKYSDHIGAFPAPRLGHKSYYNPKQSCFFFGLVKRHCNAYAFQNNFNSVSPPEYLYLGTFVRQGPSCPTTDKCKVCMLKNLCMVPQPE